MKVVVDIPEVPKNDKQRWALANGTPYAHGEWIDHSDEGYVECPFCEHATTCDDNIEELHYCFFCGASMIPPNSEIEKSKSEIVPDYRDGWRLKEGETE